MPAKKGERTQIRPLQKRTHRIIAEPQKRGPKGYFSGTRLAFLTGYCDEYIALRGKDRHQFWSALFSEWWKRYPWRLDDHEEPPTNNREKMKELAYARGEDKDAKSAVEKRLREVCLFA